MSTVPSTAPANPERPALFFCCAPVDRAHRTTLINHLAGLFRERFAPWSEDDVPAGAEHDAAIRDALDRATVIVLLVSADLLASTRHYDKAMKRALARHERGEALVIPVILRACDWLHEPFAKLQALPREDESSAARIPVLSAKNMDEAFTSVAVEIRKAAEAFTPTAPAPVVPAPPPAVVNPAPAAVVPAAPLPVVPAAPSPAAHAPAASSSQADTQQSAAPITPTVAHAPPPPARNALTLVIAAAAAVGFAAWQLSRSPAAPDPAPSSTPTATSSTTAPPPSTSPSSTTSVPPLSSFSPSVVNTRPTSQLPTAPGGSTAPVASSAGSASSTAPTDSAPAVVTVTSGNAACNGTVCTLRAQGGLVTGTRFCLSAPASAAQLEDLSPTCSGKQPAPGEDFSCIRTDQAASIALRGSITWRVCQ